MLYVNPLQNPGAASQDAAAKRAQAFQEMEQLFVYKMLREMRRTVPESSLFPKNSQRAYFEELLDDALSKRMAESGQMGIASAMERQTEAALAGMKAKRNLQGVLAEPRYLPLAKATSLPLEAQPYSEGIALPGTAAKAYPLQRNGNGGIPLRGPNQGREAIPGPDALTESIRSSRNRNLPIETMSLPLGQTGEL